MGEVLKFPTLLTGQVRCDDCVFFAASNSGAAFCARFAEEVLDDTVAEDCPDFDAV